MSHAAAYALALLAALLFGAAAPAGKPLLASLHPVQLAGLLYLGAALGVAPVLIARRRLRPVWRADRPTRLRLGGAILAGGVVGPVLLLLGLDRAGAASVSLWLTATAALAPLDAGADAVLGALALGALAYGASIALYIAAAQHLGATRAQLVFSAAPFFGVGLAAAFLGEPLGWEHAAAAALVAVALTALAREAHRHEHRHDPLEHEHWHRHDDGHHDHVHAHLPAWAGHSHRHAHGALVHSHPHLPDLHHRHDHAHDH